MPKLLSTDEVAASHFVKVGTAKVGMTLAARFSPKGPLAYGYYTSVSSAMAVWAIVAGL